MKKIKKKERVFVRENDILRKVSVLGDAEKIIAVLQSNGMLGDTVVNTQIYSRDKKYLSHEKLSPIIHSGEFTVSMAYDLAELTLKTYNKMLDYGIYTWDFLPHNLTYTAGHWILYDFGAFALNPKNVKTQIRNMFKICFAAFELLKIVDRKKLKRCFLNRISGCEFFKMVSLNTFLIYEFRKDFCLFLNILGFRRLSYKYLARIFETYKKDFTRRIYKPVESSNEIFRILNGLIQNSEINTLFVTGKEGADWSLNSKNTLKTFVFVDDYDFTDKCYNLISSDVKYKNISTAVLYPLVDDDKIPQNIYYRALYDRLAQNRFKSDCAVFLNFEEILAENHLTLDEICKNLTGFFTKLMFIKISRDEVLLENLKSVLPDIAEKFEIISLADGYLIMCKNCKCENNSDNSIQRIRYKNANRHAECHIQSKEIIEIIRNCT